MIYSRFGTPLALVSKTQSAGGRVAVQATAGGTADTREYDPAADLTADDGRTEIDAAVAQLPLKVFENNGRRRRRPPTA